MISAHPLSGKPSFSGHASRGQFKKTYCPALALTCIFIAFSNIGILLLLGRTKGEVSESNVAPPAPVDKAPARSCIPVGNSVSVDSNGHKPMDIEKWADEYICGRKIPISLYKESKLPTPTPGPNDDPLNQSEAVLLSKGSPFGNLGSQFNSLFHAYDLAYETKRPIYNRRLLGYECSLHYFLWLFLRY